MGAKPLVLRGVTTSTSLPITHAVTTIVDLSENAFELTQGVDVQGNLHRNVQVGITVNVTGSIQLPHAIDPARLFHRRSKKKWHGTWRVGVTCDAVSQRVSTGGRHHDDCAPRR